MGAYSYCQYPGCGMGLDAATAREVVERAQECALGHINVPNRTLGDIVIEQGEQIDELTRRLDEESIR